MVVFFLLIFTRMKILLQGKQKMERDSKRLSVGGVRARVGRYKRKNGDVMVACVCLASKKGTYLGRLCLPAGASVCCQLPAASCRPVSNGWGRYLDQSPSHSPASSTGFQNRSHSGLTLWGFPPGAPSLRRCTTTHASPLASIRLVPK